MGLFAALCGRVAYATFLAAFPYAIDWWTRFVPQPVERIWFEERDLVAQFGQRYRDYRAQVGMLLPRLFRS